MAVGTPQAATPIVRSRPSESYVVPMVLMVSLYFSIGFITALNDVLVAHFKDLFHLSNARALLVQLFFFGAYFVLSLPAGWIIERIGYKSGIIAALGTMSAGLMLFVPASIAISYPVFLFSMFVVGSGLALLQVAINPYVGALGSPATAAWRINICGLLNSSATTIAPLAGAAFIFIAAGATVAQLARSVRTPYVLLACFTVFLAVVTAFVPLPELIESSTKTLTVMNEGSAWGFVHLRLGALAIFTYVGAEVAIGSVLINFLGQPSMGSMPHAAAARFVSLYWAGALLGRFVGSFVLLRVKAENALLTVASVAAVMLVITIFGHGPVALWAIVSCGLYNSVMWPCIFPLGVKGLGKFTSQGSGILVMMVVGGAVIPEIQGLLADKFGYQPSFAVILLCYVYLVYFAVSGYKVRQPRFPSLPNFVPPTEV